MHSFPESRKLRNRLIFNQLVILPGRAPDSASVVLVRPREQQFRAGDEVARRTHPGCQKWPRPDPPRLAESPVHSDFWPDSGVLVDVLRRFDLEWRKSSFDTAM